MEDFQVLFAKPQRFLDPRQFEQLSNLNLHPILREYPQNVVVDSEAAARTSAEKSALEADGDSPDKDDVEMFGGENEGQLKIKQPSKQN